MYGSHVASDGCSAAWAACSAATAAAGEAPGPPLRRLLCSAAWAACSGRGADCSFSLLLDCRISLSARAFKLLVTSSTAFATRAECFAAATLAFRFAADGRSRSLPPRSDVVAGMSAMDSSSIFTACRGSLCSCSTGLGLGGLGCRGSGDLGLGGFAASDGAGSWVRLRERRSRLSAVSSAGRAGIRSSGGGPDAALAAKVCPDAAVRGFLGGGLYPPAGSLSSEGEGETEGDSEYE